MTQNEDHGAKTQILTPDYKFDFQKHQTLLINQSVIQAKKPIVKASLTIAETNSMRDFVWWSELPINENQTFKQLKLLWYSMKPGRIWRSNLIKKTQSQPTTLTKIQPLNNICTPKKLTKPSSNQLFELKITNVSELQFQDSIHSESKKIHLTVAEEQQWDLFEDEEDQEEPLFPTK